MDTTQENILTLLRELINSVNAMKRELQNQSSDYIQSNEARDIALREFELTVPITTLNRACTRGVIAQAQKNGGRWQFPRNVYMTWLRNYASTRT